MLAPDGRCKTLDAAAEGYVRAEAVGAVWLRCLRSVAGLTLGPNKPVSPTRLSFSCPTELPAYIASLDCSRLPSDSVVQSTRLNSDGLVAGPLLCRLQCCCTEQR